MQVLEILLEENFLGSVRPVEVVANVPVSLLVPALVEELNLPQTDSYGRQLAYRLCSAFEGRVFVLPEDKSLGASGIQPGAKLALDCYLVSGFMPSRMPNDQEGYDRSFYSSMTLTDYNNLPALDKHTSALMPSIKKKGRRLTRRAFILLGGAVLGIGTGIGYATYRSSMNSNPTKMEPTVVAKRTPLTKPTIPTMARALLSFTQHQQPVHAVAWSPVGSMLASGANDGRLLIWNTAGVVHTQVQQAGPVRAIAWSPDGQKIAAGAANQVTFLDPLAGTVLARSTHRHTAAVTALAWSTSHSLWMVSGALDKQAVVWNTTTYHTQTIFTRHMSPIESLSWAPDGQTIGSSSLGGVVRVWNAVNGQEVHGYYFDGQTPLHASAFAPSGAQLAVGGDDSIVRLWNGLICLQQRQSEFGTQCMDAPTHLHAHTKTVRTLAWSPDARLLATGGDDGLLAIWYPAQSHVPLFVVHHDTPVQALAWSPDGKQVATGSGNTVTIWEFQ